MRINKLITLLAILPLVTTLSAKSMQNHSYKIGQHKSSKIKKSTKLSLYPTVKYNEKMIKTAISLATLTMLREKLIPTGETKEQPIYENDRVVGYKTVPVMEPEMSLEELYLQKGFEYKLINGGSARIKLLSDKQKNGVMIFEPNYWTTRYKDKKIGKVLGVSKYKKEKSDKEALSYFKNFKPKIDKYLQKLRGKNIYVVSFGQSYGDITDIATLTALYIKNNYNTKVFYYSFNSKRAVYKDMYKMFESDIKGSFHISTYTDTNYDYPNTKKLKNWNHVGQLLRLGLNGIRVPLKDIKKRKVVKSDISVINVLNKHLIRCQTRECYKVNALRDATKKEREDRYQ